MGSFRRRLALGAAVCTPAPAWAEVCDKVRPNWVPGTDPTLLGEAIALLSMPVSLVLLITSALCIRLGRQWATLVVVVLWSFWVYFVATGDFGGIRQAAIQEGCMGKPTLFIVFVAVICGAMIVYTTRRQDKQA